MIPFYCPRSIYWIPESSGWRLRNLLPSSGRAALFSRWLPILFCVPSPCPRPDPSFHGTLQFVCKGCQVLLPTPGMKLSHPVWILRRWAQYPTRRQIIFWCKSATPGCMELLEVPPTIMGSLARLNRIFFAWCNQEKGLGFMWIQVLFLFRGGVYLENFCITDSVLLLHSKIAKVSSNRCALNKKLIYNNEIPPSWN